MANIVVAIYNPLIRGNGIYPYFEVFLQELKALGNNVLCFEKVALEIKLNENIPDRYLEQIQNFKPDLFILFNNQFWDISKYFDCPIIIYDVDSPNAFGNIEKLKGNGRYKYLTIQKDGIDIIQKALESSDIEVQYIPPFTGLKADNTNPNINIAFCGSHWVWNDFVHIENFARLKPTKDETYWAKQVYKLFCENPFSTSEELYESLGVNPANKLRFNDNFILSTRISGLKRLRYLLAIEDLGLEIRGLHWTAPGTLLKSFPELLLSYSSDVVNDMKTTESFYNSAKIGLNINHIQAKSGFSWRVADILASNACLVTEPSADFKDLKFKVATFESPAELRDVCKKLQNNENLRMDLIQYAHEIIDKNHRFSSILPIIEDFSGVKLHSDIESKTGSLHIECTDDGKSKIISNKFKKPDFPNINKRQLSFKNKICYKLSRYFYKKVN